MSKTCIDETQFEISGLSLQGIFGSTKVDISSFLTIYTGKNTLDKTSALMKWFKDLRYRVFYGLFLNKNYKVISRGERSTGCAWNFCPDYLDSKSIIYGAGVGRDITFERTLVDEFGASVVLIDPSPTGAATMSKQENKIPQFKFHPVGLAARCSTLKLSPPIDEQEGSWSGFSDKPSALEVPTVDLETLMRQNGHNHIDLLKLDIEGAEYEVMDGLLKKQIPIRQVLVEFHHGIIPGFRRGQAARLIFRMALAGYKLLDQAGNNHTFLLPARIFEKRCSIIRTPP